jgi:hypothetical protein
MLQEQDWGRRWDRTEITALLVYPVRAKYTTNLIVTFLARIVVSWKHAILCRERRYMDERQRTRQERTALASPSDDLGGTSQWSAVRCVSNDIEWYRMVHFHDRNKWNRLCYGPSTGVPITEQSLPLRASVPQGVVTVSGGGGDALWL